MSGEQTLQTARTFGSRVRAFLGVWTFASTFVTDKRWPGFDTWHGNLGKLCGPTLVLIKPLVCWLPREPYTRIKRPEPHVLSFAEIKGKAHKAEFQY
jgi:hypothetical protein